MENKKDFDFDATEPKLRANTIILDSQSTPEEKQEHDRISHQNDKIFDIDYKAWSLRKDQYEANKPEVGAILWSRCSPSMRARLDQIPDIAEMKADPIKLLSAIQQHSNSYESTQYQYKTVLESILTTCRLKQGDDKDKVSYLQRYKS